MSDQAMIVEAVEFPEGMITVCDNGEIRFMFRGMDFIYERGRDNPEGMGIVIGKETADTIKRFFRRINGC